MKLSRLLLALLVLICSAGLVAANLAFAPAARAQASSA